MKRATILPSDSAQVKMADRSIPAAVNPGGARRASITYALSMAALIAAVLLRYVLDPWMGDALVLITLPGAVAAAVWIGG